MKKTQGLLLPLAVLALCFCRDTAVGSRFLTTRQQHHQHHLNRTNLSALIASVGEGNTVEPLCRETLKFRLEDNATLTETEGLTPDALHELIEQVDAETVPFVLVVVQGLPCVEHGCCEHRLLIRPKGSDVKVLKHAIGEYSTFLSKILGKVEFNNILDAGGNIGVATMVFAHLFPAAKIVVLEPQPQNCLLLRANTLALPNVRVYCKGLWDRETTVGLVPGGDRFDWGWRIKEVEAGTEGAVHTKSVPQLLEEHKLDGFDFVKADIEGAEFTVFGKGVDLSWMQKTQLLAAELHNWSGDTSQVRERLQSEGFQISFSGEYTVFAREELHARLS